MVCYHRATATGTRTVAAHAPGLMIALGMYGGTSERLTPRGLRVSTANRSSHRFADTVQTGLTNDSRSIPALALELRKRDRRTVRRGDRAAQPRRRAANRVTNRDVSAERLQIEKITATGTVQKSVAITILASKMKPRNKVVSTISSNPFLTIKLPLTGLALIEEN
ncbi:hypothetical protein EVAR_22316_1 [Eumeta japonica]|uniref:Uncharacterized protein n=1 Tax=Eumeta variegata TaxID=151549 RepID=A0A4C1UBX8_EUMVA|nr:hypothetical protein EVAR_22316_1 [Eumeta japonica]